MAAPAKQLSVPQIAHNATETPARDANLAICSATVNARHVRPVSPVPEMARQLVRVHVRRAIIATVTTAAA